MIIFIFIIEINYLNFLLVLYAMICFIIINELYAILIMVNLLLSVYDSLIIMSILIFNVIIIIFFIVIFTFILVLFTIILIFSHIIIFI